MEWILVLIVIAVPVIMIALSDRNIEEDRRNLRELDEIKRKTIYKK
jgi:hypothetical protein